MDTLLVRHPAKRHPERSYIFTVLLREFLGLEFVMVPEDRRDVELVLKSRPDLGSIIVRDVLFSQPEAVWLTKSSLPSEPLRYWNGASFLNSDVVNWPLPVLYGEEVTPGSYCVRDNDRLLLGVDIFGSAFFMLSRYEELVIEVRDQFTRFAATSSLLHRAGLLHRPIVDEYVEVLWACMSRLWPQLKRKVHEYRFFLSSDVDHPLSNTHGKLTVALRKAVADVVTRHDLKSAITRFPTAVLNARGDYSTDPHNTFDFIMDTAERYGLKCAFYFIAGHSGGTIDGDYTLDMPWIRNLMRNIHERGHEIGLHPSFDTFLDGEKIKREFSTLLRTCDDLGIQQDIWGGRQHYLRWQAPDTWQHWESAGLTYDSTVGFADHVGFRAGTCREFPVFNLRTRSALNLIERPLIVMEGTLLNPRYMNVGTEEAIGWIERLASICRRYNGNFTLLWHNSMLTTPELKWLFRDAIASAV